MNLHPMPARSGWGANQLRLGDCQQGVGKLVQVVAASASCDSLGHALALALLHSNLWCLLHRVELTKGR